MPELTSNHFWQSDFNRRRAILQLKRLETLTDVIFGITICWLFSLLPGLAERAIQWPSLSDIPTSVWAGLGLTAASLAVVIVYWVQSSVLLAYFEVTDARHSTFALLQIVFVLLFMLIVTHLVAAASQPHWRLLASVAAGLVGMTSWLGFRHAVRTTDMLTPGLSCEDVQQLSLRALVEPLTAAITIPFAFAGAVWWALAWLSYLPLYVWLSRRRKKTKVDA